MAKLVNLTSFTVFFNPQALHQGLNKESNATDPLGTSPDTPHSEEDRGGKGQGIFRAVKHVSNLAPSALTPDQEVWESKEQRHQRQMDTNHHSPESNLVVLIGSCAPVKKPGQELGNQSSLTCRQWLANSYEMQTAPSCSGAQRISSLCLVELEWDTCTLHVFIAYFYYLQYSRIWQFRSLGILKIPLSNRNQGVHKQPILYTFSLMSEELYSETTLVA